MGISFGSNSMKPYVGGKEVQEAYVGSQLVYQAKLPYVYYFLGAENDYIIDNTVIQLSGASAAIAKEGGIYRIALTSSSGGTPGYVRVNLGAGNVFTFTVKAISTYAQPWTMYINFYQNNVYRESQSYRITIGSEYTRFSVTVPTNANNVRLTHNLGSSSTSYIDSIMQELN